jgi:DUF4097 and DUF4098 domain-containing protein YvlB
MISTNFKIATLALLLCAPITLLAQGKTAPCPDNHQGDSDTPHLCELREITIPATASLNVDGKENGGVSVTGADRSDISIQAEVVTWGRSESSAHETQQQVRVLTDGGRIRAEGPKDNHYAVSYKIEVPRSTSLDVHANNGGIELAQLDGKLRFETVNGGVELASLAGDVKGETTNGGVDVTLDGSRWSGTGLDVRTTNGGVDLKVPSGYAAHLDLSTVNGGLDIGFPVTTQGKIKDKLSADIGGGGPTIHLETINGGVDVATK